MGFIAVVMAIGALMFDKSWMFWVALVVAGIALLMEL